MGETAAKEDDRIVGADTHVVMVPSGASEVPTPMTLPVEGKIAGELSNNVRIHGKRAATERSTATLVHTPPPGTRFQTEPRNRGTVRSLAATVNINGERAALAGAGAVACDDPAEPAALSVADTGTVRFG